MVTRLNEIRRRATALLIGLTMVVSAQTQDYPNKPITLVMPYAAGGPYDEIVRVLGQRLTEIWGQAVVVENRGGGGTVIGTDAVAKAAPDGYTLLLSNVATMATAYRHPLMSITWLSNGRKISEPVA